MPRPPRKKYLAALAAKKTERQQREAEEASSVEDGAAADRLPSRARMPARESTVEQRVAYIVEEMIADRWYGYITRKELAAAWGVTDSAIRIYSAEANRYLAYDEGDREAKRRSLAMFLDAQRERAATMLNKVTLLPSFDSAIRATELEAKFLRLDIDPAKKFELTGANGGPITTADVTPTEARRLIAESFGERVIAPTIASETTGGAAPDDEGPGEGSTA